MHRCLRFGVTGWAGSLGSTLADFPAQALMALQGQNQVQQQRHRNDTVGRPDEGGVAAHIEKFGDVHFKVRVATHRVPCSLSRISDRAPAKRAVTK